MTTPLLDDDSVTPIERETIKDELREKIKIKQKLFDSIDVSKLKDKGQKIQEQIQNIEKMVDLIETGDDVTFRAIRRRLQQSNLPSKPSTEEVEPAQGTDTKLKTEEDIDDLLGSLTSRFSKLGVSDISGTSYNSQTEKKWNILVMGTMEYEAAGGDNRKKVEVIPFEEAKEILERERLEYFSRSMIKSTPSLKQNNKARLANQNNTAGK